MDDVSLQDQTPNSNFSNLIHRGQSFRPCSQGIMPSPHPISKATYLHLMSTCICTKGFLLSFSQHVGLMQLPASLLSQVNSLRVR